MNGNETAVLMLQVVDVSGSMSGEVISGINASFEEWIAELESVKSSFHKPVYWGGVYFAEEYKLVEPQVIDKIMFNQITIPTGQDGRYQTTDCSVMVDALNKYLDSYSEIIGDNPKVYIYFFTDGLFTDDQDANANIRLLENMHYKKATKTLVICGEGSSLKPYSSKWTMRLTEQGVWNSKISYEEFCSSKGDILGEISEGYIADDDFVSAFD